MILNNSNKNDTNLNLISFLKESESVNSYQNKEDLNQKDINQPYSFVSGVQQSENKKYSEEDILLLIKFIVKEFAKVIQKWTFTQNQMLPLLNFGGATPQSMNTLLLTSLLAKEMTNQQNQELIQHSLIQQLNPSELLEMIEKNKVQNKETVIENNASEFHSAPFPTNFQKDIEISQHTDDHKHSESMNCNEIKDEIETIQSSEDKSGKNQSSMNNFNDLGNCMSEDASNQSKKITLNQAYQILSQNSVLDTLIQTFSSSN